MNTHAMDATGPADMPAGTRDLKRERPEPHPPCSSAYLDKVKPA